LFSIYISIVKYPKENEEAYRLTTIAHGTYLIES